MLFATNLIIEISRKQQISCQSIPISHTSLERRNASSQESQSLREFGFGMETIEQWQKRAKVAAAWVDRRASSKEEQLLLRSLDGYIPDAEEISIKMPITLSPRYKPSWREFTSTKGTSGCYKKVGHGLREIYARPCMTVA